MCGCTYREGGMHYSSKPEGVPRKVGRVRYCFPTKVTHAGAGRHGCKERTGSGTGERKAGRDAEKKGRDSPDGKSLPEKNGGDLLSRLRSTIGVHGLNCSVRNGKRWNPAALGRLNDLNTDDDTKAAPRGRTLTTPQAGMGRRHDGDSDAHSPRTARLPAGGTKHPGPRGTGDGTCRATAGEHATHEEVSGN